MGVPMPVAAGLPLGLQMIGAPDTDASLLNAALAVERLLRCEHGYLVLINSESCGCVFS